MTVSNVTKQSQLKPVRNRKKGLRAERRHFDIANDKNSKHTKKTNGRNSESETI